MYQIRFWPNVYRTIKRAQTFTSVDLPLSHSAIFFKELNFVGDEGVEPPETQFVVATTHRYPTPSFCYRYCTLPITPVGNHPCIFTSSHTFV